MKYRAICKRCDRVIKFAEYETGIEYFCKCQCTLDPDFNYEFWKPDEEE